MHLIFCRPQRHIKHDLLTVPVFFFSGMIPLFFSQFFLRGCGWGLGGGRGSGVGSSTHLDKQARKNTNSDSCRGSGILCLFDMLFQKWNESLTGEKCVVVFFFFLYVCVYVESFMNYGFECFFAK